MDFQFLKVGAAAGLLLAGACTTMTAETASNKEVEENSETVVGYDVPLGDELIPAAGKSNSREQDDNIVCKRIQVTGSKFNKKVCMTWGEWKARQKAGKEYMIDQNHRQYRQGNPQGG